MTPAQHAERLHEISRLTGQRQGRAIRPWALLPEEYRARLVEASRKLQAEYAAGEKPESKGIR